MNRKIRLLLITAVIILFSMTTWATPRLIDRKYFAFVYRVSGLRIDYDVDINELRSILGESIVSFTHPDGSGFKIYTWEGLQLKTLPDNDIIVDIKILNDQFESTEGIRIGSILAEVLQKYGPPSVETRNYVDYLYSDMSETWGLIFRIRNPGTVTIMQINRED